MRQLSQLCMGALCNHSTPEIAQNWSLDHRQAIKTLEEQSIILHFVAKLGKDRYTRKVFSPVQALEQAGVER